MLAELLNRALVYFANLVHQGHTCHQHWLMLVSDKFIDNLYEVLNCVRNILDSSDGCKTRPLPDVGWLRLHQLFYFRIKFSAHFGWRNFGNCSQTQGNDKCLFGVEISLYGVCDQHEDVTRLVKQLAETEVANPFLGEAWRWDKFDTFYLPESCRIT